LESVGEANNRQKNYILKEGMVIPPLIKLGVFTKEGKVVASMYSKYKQINRFIELIDDVIKEKEYESMNIVDFGCGKSYLTFILYYYLTEIKHIDATITGLDLKQEVIDNCNEVAREFGYDKVKFEHGDIGKYEHNSRVDMVVTLHACDTATDLAIYNAVKWGAEVIMSVPCCQHEINGQIESEKYVLLTKYGILKERFSAIVTDAVRGNMLELAGYQTQIIEFVDFTHSPKNILIRAVKGNVPQSKKDKALAEIKNIVSEFKLKPKLYELLKDELK
jgi:SAM-dependent methyltransferase